jgi:large subunit ribosomal protein L25
MEELKIKAAKRDVFGKRTRFLRRQGITPTHLFGRSLESIPLQCDTKELKKIVTRAGTTRIISLDVEGENEAKNVFLREIQKDAITRELLHVDFYQVRKGEKMTMDVPIVLVGEAPAMKAKGRIISRGTTVLSLECLPEKVPPQIEVDISGLVELDQSIYVKDIHLDPDITVNDDPELLVVKISEVVIKVEEEVPVAEVEAEGEAVAEGEEGAEGEAAEGEEGAGAEKKAPADRKTPVDKKAPPTDKKAPEKKAPEKKE